MATLASFQDKADRQFEAFFNKIVHKQKSKFKGDAQGSKRYRQFPVTHTAIPADGVDASPDNLSAKSTGEPESLSDVGITPGSSCVQMSVSRYVGPRGHGLVVIGKTIADGTTYVRSKGSGGASEDFTQSWLPVSEIPPIP